MAVIPSKEGTVTIPEITLSWWDTKTNQPKTAKLPAKTLQVSPAEEAAQVAAPPVVPQLEQSPLSTTIFYEETLKKWQYATAALLGLWLLTLLAYFRKSSVAKEAKRKADPVNRRRDNPTAKKVFNELKASLKSNDYKQVESLVIRLINLVGYPQIRSLGALAQRVKTDAVARKLRALEGQRYSAAQQDGKIELDKSDIDQILRDLDRRQKKAASSSIPPLYAR